MIHFVGDNSIIELPSRRRREANGAISTVRRFRGVKEDIDQFIASVPVGIVIDEQPDEDSPYSTIELSIPDPQDGTDDEENIVTTWSFRTNRSERDLLVHPKVLALPNAEREYLKKAVNSYDQMQRRAQNTWLFSSPDAALAFDRHTRGLDSFAIAEFVAIKNTVVSPNFVGDFVDRLNHIFTLPQLLSYEGNSGPSDAVLAEMQSVGGEWMKMAVDKEEQSNGLVTVTVEYWHADQWDDWKYPRAFL